MELEVGQVWYGSDGHIEVVVKIDEDTKKVSVIWCDFTGHLVPETLEYGEYPEEVMAPLDDCEFTLVTTLKEMAEICKNERHKTVHSV